MAHISKRFKAIAGKVDRSKFYPLPDALQIIKETATAKFDESIDVAVNLGIDAKKSDQSVRGSVVLPAGTGTSSDRPAILNRVRCLRLHGPSRPIAARSTRIQPREAEHQP